MKRRTFELHLDGLIALLLFGVFAVCVLIVLLTGADAYRRLTQRDQEAYTYRTYIQYMAARVRQSDSLNGVSLEEFGDGTALVLSEGDYVTRVYCMDGYIMELYSTASSDLDPEAGERLMDAKGLKFSLEGSLLHVTVIDTDGKRNTILLSLRSGEGAAA